MLKPWASGDVPPGSKNGAADQVCVSHPSRQCQPTAGLPAGIGQQDLRKPREQRLPASHPVEQWFQAGIRRHADAAEPGHDRRAPADKRDRPVARPVRQGRGVVIEHPLHGPGRQPQLAGGSPPAAPGAIGRRDAVGKYHARRGPFEFRQKVRAHEGRGWAASPDVMSVFQHQRAPPRHAVAQLVSQLGEKWRPPIHRPGPCPHQLERGLAYTAARPLRRRDKRHQEGSRVTILWAQAKPKRISARPCQGRRQPFGEHMPGGRLENSHPAIGRVLKRAVQCLRVRPGRC
jgi:hypothetical protein